MPLSLINTKIGNRYYISFINNNNNIGKCVFEIKIDHVKIIQFYIKDNYRGRGLLYDNWANIEEIIRSYGKNKILLDAKENFDRYGKLIKYYQKIGFNIKNNHERIIDIGDNIFRSIKMEKIID